MKKLFALLLSAVLVLSMDACSSEPKQDENLDADGNVIVEELNIAFVPSKDPEEILSAAAPLENLLAARIDEINILNASFEGMSQAVQNLSLQPQFLAIDGNRFRTTLPIPYQCIVKGDGKYADIAAASVLAKTFRDEYMLSLAEEYPQYGWAKNKGYPTRDHRLAIRKYGLSPYHRLTFNHEIDQLELPM